jgi:hypothetical protein
MQAASRALCMVLTKRLEVLASGRFVNHGKMI